MVNNELDITRVHCRSSRARGSYLLTDLHGLDLGPLRSVKDNSAMFEIFIIYLAGKGAHAFFYNELIMSIMTFF